MFLTTAELINTISILGTVAIALSAVLAGSEKKTDIFTVAVLGLITAVGGSTRDVLLGVSVFWSEELYYVWIAVVSSLMGFICVYFLRSGGFIRLTFTSMLLLSPCLRFKVLKKHGAWASGYH